MRRISEEIDIQNEKIIEVAIKEFCNKGFAHTRLDDIGKALGITRTPIYYQFKSKAGLFDAAIRHIIDAMYENDIFVFKQDMNIYDKFVRAFLDCTVVACQQRVMEMGQILTRHADIMPDTLAYMDEISERLYDLKLAALREAKEKGEINPDVRVSELLNMIMASYTGVLSWSSGVARVRNLADEQTSKMAQHLVRQIFDAIYYKYFNAKQN